MFLTEHFRAIVRGADQMDRRQRKTRTAIFNAFTYLLKTENYSKITVQQIIDIADIGRTTFYSHFETKDDLLKYLSQEIFDHVFSEDLNKEKTHDFSQNHGTRDRIRHILYHLQEHMDYLPGILSGDGGDIFMESFKKYLIDLFTPSVRSADKSAPDDYILNHMICDFSETIRWWSRNPKYTPDEICSFFLENTPIPE